MSVELFCNLLKNGQITFLKDLKQTYLNFDMCYFLALTNNNCQTNMSRFVFNKDGNGLYLFVFTSRMIYRFDTFPLDKSKVLQMVHEHVTKNKRTHNKEKVFWCFPKKRSFGHSICNIIGLLYQNFLYHNFNYQPCTGFTTKHIIQLINVFKKPFILDEVNVIYQINNFCVFKDMLCEMPENINTQMLSTLKSKIFLKKDINYPVCFIKTQTQKNKFTLGQVFQQNNLFNSFVKRNNVKLFNPENLNFTQMVNLIYNAKTLVVQWGALSFIQMIFRDNQSLLKKDHTQKVIILQHKSYSREILLFPSHYIIIRNIDPNWNIQSIRQIERLI